jgi:hypothetical protein
MRRRAFRLLAPLALLAGATPALANWTASGCLSYEDRPQDSTGFLGTIVPLPVRSADVEIIDANKSGSKATLARGKTDASGCFSIAVSDSATRTVYLRVLTTSTQTSGLVIKVQAPGGAVYAIRTANLPNHGPNTHVNWGTLVAAVGSGGEAFNVFDQLKDGAEFVKAVKGSYPSPTVTVNWAANAGELGASYLTGCCTIILRDYAGYDDTVILHEWGHYVEYQYWGNQNPTGTHALADCNQSLKLAFPEGRATWFGNSVKRHFNRAASNVYLRTTGAAGPGGLQNWFDLEGEPQYPCDGYASEVAIARSLWDIHDGASTPDATPGVDDGPMDTLSLADFESWQVNAGPARTATSITYESFWDGWFDPSINNGNLAAMRSLHDELGMQFRPDVYEPNETPATSTPVASNGGPWALTFFADPDGNGKGQADTDVFRLAAVGGVVYTVTTSDLVSDANTNLELLDTNGSTVLATNNDCPGFLDGSSCLTVTAPRTDTFYVRVKHAADAGIYGSYTLSITHP